MKILVSACLCGENCKYDGGNNACQPLMDFVRNHELISVCPEMMGGLPAPRPSAEIVNGVVMNKLGENVDVQFRKGAKEALNIAQKEEIDLAVLQPRSPSCGCSQVYDGTFSRKLIPGKGVFAQELSDNHIEAVDAGSVRIVNGVAFIRLSERGTKVEEQALDLALRVFMEQEAPEYPIEGVEEFKRALKSEDYLKQLQLYVAIAADGVVGMLATRESGTHVALFFVDSKYHHRGIGRELINIIEYGKSNTKRPQQG